MGERDGDHGGTSSAVQDAERRGLAVEWVERGPADSLRAAADLLGIEVGDLVKTLVVRRATGDYLLVLVPGGRRLSWPRLRAAVSANRLALPSPDEAFEATGYRPGTITPLGARGPWPVIADARIPGRRIAIGSGSPGASILVDADALVAAFAAQVLDISDEE